MAKTKTPAKAPEATTEAPASTKSAPAAINQVALIGRLTADPVLRVTSTGKAVANFRLAVTNAGPTSFMNITCWAGLAETIAKYSAKGRLVAVVGRLDSHQWLSADGEKRSSVGVTAQQVQFLDRKAATPEVVIAA